MDLLTENPDLDQVIAVDTGSRGKRLMEKISQGVAPLRQLTSRPDLVVDLTANDHSTLLALGSRGRLRIGRLRNKGFWGRNRCYHRTFQPNPKIPMVAQLLEILSAIDLHPQPEQFPLRLNPSAAAQASLSALLKPTEAPLIHFSPVSRLLKKCWRSERMAQLIDHVASRGGVPVVTSAPNPQERQLAQAVLEQVTTATVIDLTGQLSVGQLIALIHRSHGSVSVDSAPMHMAAALGKPVLAIFGPTNEALWAPWQATHRIVTNPLPCRRPCQHKRTCTTYECVQDITVEQATQAFDDLMPTLTSKEIP